MILWLRQNVQLGLKRRLIVAGKWVQGEGRERKGEKKQLVMEERVEEGKR